MPTLCRTDYGFVPVKSREQILPVRPTNSSRFWAETVQVRDLIGNRHTVNP